MINRIKINCRKVYDNGELYLNTCDDGVNILKRLDNISTDISKIWGGADGNNFVVSLNKHIKELDKVINFLGFNGDLLKRSALEHSGVDNDFATKVERSELDEQRI